MELMIIKDVFIGKNDQTVLTGPLLLKEFTRRSEVEKAFGERIVLLNSNGEKLIVPVNGVSVSQSMSGSWQVSVAVDYNGNKNVSLDSIVTDHA